jgi:hypothetical protein
VAFFFDVAYAVVIFLALAAVGAVPGCVLGLIVGRPDRRLLLPAVPLAFAGWIWFGWIGSPYGISRFGLVLFAAVGAMGFVRGWLFGIEVGARIRRRPAPPRGDSPGQARRSRKPATRA